MHVNNIKNILIRIVIGTFFLFDLQKYKEYLNGSNLIIKLQAKHDLLKQTLGEGEAGSSFTLCICVVWRSALLFFN